MVMQAMHCRGGERKMSSPKTIVNNLLEQGGNSLRAEEFQRSGEQIGVG